MSIEAKKVRNPSPFGFDLLSRFESQVFISQKNSKMHTIDWALFTHVEYH